MCIPRGRAGWPGGVASREAGRGIPAGADPRAIRGHLNRQDPTQLGPDAAPARPRVFSTPAYVGLNDAGPRHRVLYRQPQRLDPRRGARPCARSSRGSKQVLLRATIGAEFAHVSDSDERLWLQDEFQPRGACSSASARDERRNILGATSRRPRDSNVTCIRAFCRAETLLPLEGGEALIPLLRWNSCRESGRGWGRGSHHPPWPIAGPTERAGQTCSASRPADLFSEFRGARQNRMPAPGGPSNTHKGVFSADLRTPGGKRATWCWPSILRTLRSSTRWPRASVRARQERRGDTLGEKVLPILVSWRCRVSSGQGVVHGKTLQMSQTRGFGTRWFDPSADQQSDRLLRPATPRECALDRLLQAMSRR